MLELACREAIFHFNKHHLIDPTTPMWVIKTKGKTYMVDHVNANIPWSTKETPANNATKGSIKFKNVLVRIDGDNCAYLEPLKISDVARLKVKRYTRILINAIKTVPEYLEQAKIAHTKFKKIYGSCGSGPWLICDIKDPNAITMLQLAMPANSFRILQENEQYYKIYDKVEEEGYSNDIDMDEYWVEEDYEEEDDE